MEAKSVEETPDAVFEALLKDWDGQAIQIDGEWGVGGKWDIDRDVAEWRARFGNAIARERNARG